MLKGTVKRQIYFPLLCLLVGGTAALLSLNGFQIYKETAVKPPISPPAWVFPAVWTVLYLLMGLSAARIFSGADQKLRNSGKNLFILQLVLNFFWTLIFFRAGAYGGALVCLVALWLAVLGMVLTFWQVDPTAALLQIPYLLWTSFALYLNYAVWQWNQPHGIS